MMATALTSRSILPVRSPRLVQGGIWRCQPCARATICNALCAELMCLNGRKYAPQRLLGHRRRTFRRRCRMTSTEDLLFEDSVAPPAPQISRHVGFVDDTLDLLAPVRADVVGHSLNSMLETPAHLRCFMEYHVFAVYDFMSLVKRLQRDLTCLDIPWLPPNRKHARLINEIVMGEESDADGHGGYTSHLELYMEAMQQAGAHVGLIHAFMAALAEGKEAEQALRELGAPMAVQQFVGTTLDIALNGTTAEVCASFFFGREELIPGLFEVLLESLKANNMATDRLEYYLERHMEVDAEHHGPMAKVLLEDLCGNSKERYNAAQVSAKRSLQARVALWDGVMQAL